MAQFDRFDICEAYYALENEWNVGGILQERGRPYSIGVQLHRIRFRPSLSFNGYESLTANGAEIYREAVERFRLGDGGYINCACRDCGDIAIGRIGALCHECQDAGCMPCHNPGDCRGDEHYGHGCGRLPDEEMELE